MKILAIESSCDDTAAAVVEDGRNMLSNVVSSQISEHKIYGGVVPEIASRRHTEAISDVVFGALGYAYCKLSDIDAIAVTYAPGLIGALLVGVNFAKGLSLSTGLPLVPVHHLRSHIAANYLTQKDLKPPFLALVVSGGHTHIVEVTDYTKMKVIGATRDDAAGEAMDKSARALGIDYPGGLNLDRIAKDGDPHAYKFPKVNVTGPGYDYSFSGIKTYVINNVHTAAQKGIEINTADMGASLMTDVASMLCSNLERAAEDLGHSRIVLAGGVSANSFLRARAADMCASHGWELFMPQLPYCGDNGAMVGAQAYYEFLAGRTADLSLNACASMSVE
jgi:N6-L-threonylcarbamoyladenine synthase